MRSAPCSAPTPTSSPRVYDVTPDGNWEEANILNRLRSGWSDDPALEARLARLRDTLLAHRAGGSGPVSTTRCWPTGTG